MSLDKQRILSELGSVMNKLQNADCGCMGKLFTNPNQSGQGGLMSPTVPAYGGCRHGCCHGGNHNSQGFGHGCNHGTPGAGEPAYAMNGPTYMKHCNPPQLYSDTFNYLNKNLVQPVVQEVYHDLKTITPDNTIMNNSLAAQMGFAGGETKNSIDLNAPMRNDNFVNSFNNMPVASSQQNENTGGMGPQIVNMFMGDNKGDGKKHAVPGGQLPGSVGSPHIPESNAYTNNSQPSPNLSPVPFVQNPTSQYLPPNANAPNNISSVVPQKILSNQPTNQSYGQHTQAIMKFKEMFPEVTQGDLGYDPMAIAIQMNPANQSKAAMNTMQKYANICKDVTQAEVSSVQPQKTQYQQGNAFLAGEQINHSTIQNTSQEIAPSQHHVQNNKMQPVDNPSAPGLYQQNQINLNSDKALGQQQMQSYNQSSMPLPSNDSRHFNNQESGLLAHNNKFLPPQDIVKEPILPSDDPRNIKSEKYNEYNTLGQSIEKFPAHLYRPPQASLPQTLSPQSTQEPRNDLRYSKVKFTESKTSLLGNKSTRKTPSRNQLQHIYNQYRGSQSYTQQNLNPATYGSTLSDGNLNIAKATTNAVNPNVIPMEKHGGDTIANMQEEYNYSPKQVIAAKEPVNETHQGDNGFVKPSGIPTRQAKCRNGLQDMTYTSYPTSTAWSFHGTQNFRPMPRGRDCGRW